VERGNKDSIADLLFSTTKGIGLSAWRFNLGAGWKQTFPIHGDSSDIFKHHLENMMGHKMRVDNGFFKRQRKEASINFCFCKQSS
jgi:hypothetical protein